MAASDDESLSAAECASRTGLTVRALRVYEREGLLSPARSAKGWRRYGPADLARLNTIVILKTLGLTLAQIRDLLTETAPSLLSMLEVQAQSWKIKLAATQRAVHLLEAACRRLQSHQELSVYELCDLIKSLEGERSSAVQNSVPALRDLITELITPDEQRVWQTWWQLHPADLVQNADYVKAQNELFSRVQRLADLAVDPASPEAQKLVEEHNQMLTWYGVRARAVRMLEWNAPLVSTWMGLGAEARARHPEVGEFPDPIVNRRASNYYLAAARASDWAPALREILRDVKTLIESRTEPESADVDDSVRRLREVCRAHSFGDPYIYTQWAPFIARVNRIEAAAVNEEAWAFLARAIQARGGRPATLADPEELRRLPEIERYGTAMDLAIVRRAFAKQILAIAGVNDPRVEDAFASVPREQFLGPGPWVLSKLFLESGVATPDADPVYVYTDYPIMIVPGVNNGQPSFHANLLAQAQPSAGEHLVHIGVGLGYYTAIAAHLVGPAGRVTAVEFNADLAERARGNLSDRPNVQVLEGDGTLVEFGDADVIYVSAGATHFIDRWLDRLNEGGRLILPLTPDKGLGAVFRIERRGNAYFAQWISGVVIYPCAGARNETSEQALAAALNSRQARRVTRLYPHDLPPHEECWLRAPSR